MPCALIARNCHAYPGALPDVSQVGAARSGQHRTRLQQLISQLPNPMSGSLSRREFGRFTGAALSGLLLGSSTAALAAEKKGPTDPANLLSDPHVCRGLNTCKGKGKGGGNSCAGTGNCATAEAHSCHGDNACKGQGGCGEHPGENACKGQGSCQVPLDEKTWKKARKTFEAQMAKKKQKFGTAPEKKS